MGVSQHEEPPAGHGLPALGRGGCREQLRAELARRAPCGRRAASLALGFSVGYEGLESGLQDVVGIAFQLVVLVFIVGLLVVSRRAREPGIRAAST